MSNRKNTPARRHVPRPAPHAAAPAVRATARARAQALLLALVAALLAPLLPRASRRPLTPAFPAPPFPASAVPGDLHFDLHCDLHWDLSAAPCPDSVETLAARLVAVLSGPPHAGCTHPLLWAIGPGPCRGMRARPRAHPPLRASTARAPPIRARPPAPHHHRQSGRQAHSADGLHRILTNCYCD